MFKIGVRRVVGDSMTPKLKHNDIILVKKTRKYRTGDIVGLEFNDKILIKRISRINDSKYYVLGDNQVDSLDSRKFGWIEFNQLVFKFVCKI
ncbi:MAG TPA: S26 family signal peptidase [Candidatus Saccharimonadales bacterium]|jgi:nickel-type superoxide dismutase maturation protease|nr:S26 family signal peptidase [Candidatus Saccharimonadales bacterium]